jgi:hypothetical protein
VSFVKEKPGPYGSGENTSGGEDRQRGNCMDDDIEGTEANIRKGLAEAMEKTADRIAHEEQQIRDHIQPLGRIVSEKEQKDLNSIGTSLRDDVDHLRKTAAQLKQPKSKHQ